MVASFVLVYRDPDNFLFVINGLRPYLEGTTAVSMSVFRDGNPETSRGALWRHFVWKGFQMPLPKDFRVEFEDTDLQKRVERYLYSRDPSAFRDLNIEVQLGRVTLTGPVETYYERQVALNTCQRVAGVLTTVDRMDVEEADRRLKPR